MRKIFVLYAAVAACLGAVAVATLVARGQPRSTTWNVGIGGESAGHGVQANAYEPVTITIHAGDTITWTMASFYAHTVTFLSGSPRPPVIIPQEDGRLEFSPRVLLPQGDSTYDGRGVASSGLLEGRGKSFSLTFTNPGRYVYVCLVHPGQAGAVVVMPRGSKLPRTQAQYDTMAAAQVSQTIAQGEAAMASAKVEVEKTGKGTIYTLSLIASPTGPAAIDRFSPESLRVKVGDTVRWVMKDPTEGHTVTFSGTPLLPDFRQEEAQAQGPPRVFVNLKAVAPAGGRVHAAGPYYNSGLMTVGVPGTVQSYSLTFTKPGTYTYWCLVHVAQGMKGTIVVR
jgi:plastocyanin